MAEKYELGHIGHCPRVYCHGAKVLPVGCSDIPGQETVKLFCPSCLDVYSPPNSRFQTVDGAFFGTTFGCLFFMTFPELDVGGQKPASPQTDPSPSASSPLGTASANNQNSFDRNTRPSNASSLTSQAPPAQSSHQPPTSNPPSQQAQQPDTINGVAPKNLGPGLGLGNIYEPRIYGFRVSEVARTGPRMKWLRSRPVDVNELDETRLWAQSQEVGTSQADLADSEMVDDNEEIDNGEVEDEEMDAIPDEQPPAENGVESAQVREVTQRKKQSRRRNHDALLNGNAGGTAVKVGDGG